MNESVIWVLLAIPVLFLFVPLLSKAEGLFTGCSERMIF